MVQTIHPVFNTVLKHINLLITIFPLNFRKYHQSGNIIKPALTGFGTLSGLSYYRQD